MVYRATQTSSSSSDTVSGTATTAPLPLLDLCVILGLRPANESLPLPPLPTFPANNSCPVGEREQLGLVHRNYTEQWCMFPAEPKPGWEVGLKVAFYCVSILAALLGNLCVLGVVCSSRAMRASRTNLVIVNLAVTDLLSPVFCMLPHLGNGITAEYPFPDIVCRMSVFMQVLTVTSGVFLLTLIAIDRFLSIVFPLKVGFSRGLLAAILAITWACAVAVACPLLIYTRREDTYWYNRQESWCGEHWPSYYYETDGTPSFCLSYSPGKTVYYTVYIVFLYFIPIITMAVVYSAIVFVLWSRSKDQGRTVSNLQQKTRKKVVRMLVVLFLVFVVCYSPLQGLLLYDVYRDKDKAFPTWYASVMYAATYLAYTNSAINPFLYAGLNSNFRRRFAVILRCSCPRRNKVSVGDPTRKYGSGERRQQTTGDHSQTLRSPAAINEGAKY